MAGWIGLVLLCLAFIFVSKNQKIFLVLDGLSGVMLTIHSIMISDTTFIVVNSYIIVMCLIGLRRECKNDKQKSIKKT